MSDTTGRPSLVGPLVANWRQYIPYLGFVLIFAFFSATLFNQGFLEPNNQLNILRQTAMISIMSVGMTYVLSAGEIDLSIGMVAGLISCVVAVAMDHFGAVAGVVAGLAAGGFVGLVNGALTTRVGIPSFLTTLAMMGIARGTAMWMTSTKSVPILDDDYIWLFGGGNLGPIPVLVLWTVVVGVVGHVVLRRTTFGRRRACDRRQRDRGALQRHRYPRHQDARPDHLQPRRSPRGHALRRTPALGSFPAR